MYNKILLRKSPVFAGGLLFRKTSLDFILTSHIRQMKACKLPTACAAPIIWVCYSAGVSEAGVYPTDKIS